MKTFILAASAALALSVSVHARETPTEPNQFLPKQQECFADHTKEEPAVLAFEYLDKILAGKSIFPDHDFALLYKNLSAAGLTAADLEKGVEGLGLTPSEVDEFMYRFKQADK